jgi:hypothetical protein
VLCWINDRSFAVAKAIMLPITMMMVHSTTNSGLGARKASQIAALNAAAPATTTRT